MDTLKDFLKQTIDKNGFEYLNSNAFDIYENLIESETNQTLFSVENILEWDNKYARGLKEFCDREWSFPWEGFEVWYTG